MNAKQKLHQVKLSQWASRFQEQAESGLTVKNWCETNNISIHTYNYWKHALKETYVNSLLPDIVPIAPVPASLDIVKSSNHMTQASSCYSLGSRESCNTNSIRVLVNDTEIVLGSSASDEMIMNILRAVRHA